jgi:large subunit ribosomal protein L1
MEEAIKILKDSSFVKFDETLDIALQLGIDPRNSDQIVRGAAIMPAGTGKEIKVAVICKDDKVQEALDAGADKAGSQEIIDSIKSGKIDYDSYIATPDMMAMVGQVARVLGPKGLMPNPKLGTVAVKIADAVKNIKSGQVEFRVDKAGIIHAGIGKSSFAEKDIIQNALALLGAIAKAKPATAKGIYMKKLYLASTMGPALQIDINSLNLS